MVGARPESEEEFLSRLTTSSEMVKFVGDWLRNSRDQAIKNAGINDATSDALARAIGKRVLAEYCHTHA